VPVEAELRERTGLLCFGADDDSLASVVLELLRQRGQTLAVARIVHRWGPRCCPWPGWQGPPMFFLAA